MRRPALNAIMRGVVASYVRIKPTVKDRIVFNNQHLFQHLDRQPNVILVVIEQDGTKAQWFHALASVDLYAIGPVLMMEVRLFDKRESTEPLRVITYVNPRKWELVAQPDPETVV